MEEEKLCRVKGYVKEWYRLIRTTEYDDETYRLFMFNITYDLMKMLNPEFDIPKEGLN